MAKKWDSHLSQNDLDTNEIFFDSTYDSLKIINRIRFWLYHRVKYDFLKLNNYDDLAMKLFEFKNFRCCPKNANKLARAIYGNKKEKYSVCKCVNYKKYCHGNKPSIRQLVDSSAIDNEFNLSN